MAELADALDLGSSVYGVRVRVSSGSPSAPLAQSVEQQIFNLWALSSSLRWGTIVKLHKYIRNEVKNLIIRGTTPTHTFTLPKECNAFEKIRVSYSQNGKCVIKHDREKLNCTGNLVECTLSQEETLALKPNKLCEVQIRVVTTQGIALASEPAKIAVGECLDNEVL